MNKIIEEILSTYSIPFLKRKEIGNKKTQSFSYDSCCTIKFENIYDIENDLIKEIKNNFESEKENTNNKINTPKEDKISMHLFGYHANDNFESLRFKFYRECSYINNKIIFDVIRLENMSCYDETRIICIIYVNQKRFLYFIIFHGCRMLKNSFDHLLILQLNKLKDKSYKNMKIRGKIYSNKDTLHYFYPNYIKSEFKHLKCIIKGDAISVFRNYCFFCMKNYNEISIHFLKKHANLFYDKNTSTIYTTIKYKKEDDFIVCDYLGKNYKRRNTKIKIGFKSNDDDLQILNRQESRDVFVNWLWRKDNFYIVNKFSTNCEVPNLIPIFNYYIRKNMDLKRLLIFLLEMRTSEIIDLLLILYEKSVLSEEEIEYLLKKNLKNRKEIFNE